MISLEEAYSYAKTVLSYDPSTGEITNKVTRQYNALKGSKAGSVGKNGYRVITLKGKLLYAHRLAFILMGEELPDEVDHIDGVKSNNKWSNLRPCSRAENGRNTPARKHNALGVKGVEKNRQGKYRAYCDTDQGRLHLGVYGDLELAELVAMEARDKYHGEFSTHGRVA